MGYGEQPYDQFVMDLRAESRDGRKLAVSKLDGSRWRIGTASGKPWLIEYFVDIRGMERSILSAADTSKIREGYLGSLGYSVFGFLDKHDELPVRLLVEGPSNWPVFSTLAPRAQPSVWRLEALAANFYALADSQIVMGPALHVSQVAASVPLFLAVYDETGQAGSAMARLAKESALAMDCLTDYFGSVPFSRYTVHMELLRPVSEKHRYGFSMEHMDSATLYLAAEMAVNDASPESQWLRHRYNLAHHMAHAWIPKRSYPVGYFPFPWEKAPLLDAIWLSEGWAQYAAMAALAGRLPASQQEAFIEQILERFRSGLREAPESFKRMPLAELSRIASTRYSEDFRTGRTLFSRGGMMAYEMDRRIRAETAGRRSLRDGLRHMVNWSLREKKAFRIEDLPAMFLQSTGVDVTAVLKKWLAPLQE